MTRARRTSQRRTVESTGSRALEQSRVRLLCVGCVFLLCFLSINVRLVEIMASKHHAAALPDQQDAAGEAPEDEAVSTGDMPPRRADIIDRNGALLATSLMTQSAYADPRQIIDPAVAAARLSRVVGIPGALLLKRLKSARSFVWIKRRMTPTEQQAVNSLGIPGIYFTPEEERFYPYGNLLSHTVGYVSIDNKGLAGVEEYFDKRLTDESRDGEPLQLSIDVRVQHILHDETAHAVSSFHAAGAAGVVLDADTSEVLAMVSLPDFDPHHPGHGTDSQRFNRVAEGLYEMGSTFKSFTLAMALEDGVTSLKGSYDATNPFKYAGFTITDDHARKRVLSVPEVYAYSSNIGAAKMMLGVGPKRERTFLEKLGMLEPVDIELPPRPHPLVPKEWQGISGLTVAYGHGIAVTPLHLVRGIAALVDGGTLKPVTLLKGGNLDAPEERIISARTSHDITELMRLVVLHGTGGKADVPGYMVGGKTGTAEKVEGGGYSHNQNLVSFVSVFPVNHPRYVVLIMVDDPKGNAMSHGNATGGWVAAPAVGRVVERMAPLLGLAPDFNPRHDDAEKYWVSLDKTPKERRLAQVALPQEPLDRRYVRHAAY